MQQSSSQSDLGRMAAGASAAAPSTKMQLLTLDQVEERILHVVSVGASVCAMLSDVHPDPLSADAEKGESLSQAAAAVREFHASLRLIHVSLLAHIRTHAGEIHMHAHATGGAPAAAATGAAHGAAAAAGAAASAAREYRRNVYLDTQHMAVLMENLDIVKRRIEHAQQQHAQLQSQQLQQQPIKQEQQQQQQQQQQLHSQ